MKLLSIITHPVLVICSFCLILISGEHFGGPYLIYLLMALPHGGIHFLLALIGCGILLLGYGKYGRQYNYLIEPLMNLTGICFLFLSLYFFFAGSEGYNDSTFEQGVPLFTFILFIALATGSVLYGIIRYAKKRSVINRIPQ